MSTLNFKTNIQLKSIIGKDLINDDNIAILELVKNSFDADAKNVEVKYLNLKDNFFLIKYVKQFLYFYYLLAIFFFSNLNIYVNFYTNKQLFVHYLGYN